MKKRICFLISEYEPHHITTITSLLDNYDVEILSFSYEKKKRTPKLKNFTAYSAWKYATKDIYSKVEAFNPAIIVTSGWMFKNFISVCRKIRKKHKVRIVGYSDTPWYGRPTQKINALISPFYLKRVFDYIWVAGIRQYDYARKLGFTNNQIIFNCLSANNILFEEISIEAKKLKYPKNIVYIGRYAEVKGLKYLLEAWNSVEDKKGWKLTLIGEGPLKSKLQSSYKDNSVLWKEYMPQKKLIVELQNAGCFVLPSIYEPWALVIHEAASAGLPIICTDVCGAAPHFVIDNFNGYKVKSNSAISLKNAIENVINKSEKELLNMSLRSRELSKSINPSLTAASVMQLVEEV